MPPLFNWDLRKWAARQSLQTRFLSFSLLLTFLILVVTHWLTTLSSLRAVDATVGAETAKAAARLGSYLEQTSPSMPATEFRRQAFEILELVPHVARIDLYAKLNGELSCWTPPPVAATVCWRVVKRQRFTRASRIRF